MPVDIMRPSRSLSRERGTTLIELMVALTLLSIGILAVGRMFPTGSQSQSRDVMYTTGSYYAQQKLENLTPLSWNDLDLTDGRHPAGTATESLGGGKWQRYYVVETMAAPLDNLKKITVTVTWVLESTRSVSAVTYHRR